MSLATFWMSLTKMENLSDRTHLAMKDKAETMIHGHLQLRGDRFFGRSAREVLDKLHT